MNIRQIHANDIGQLIRLRFDFTAEFKEVDPDLMESFREKCSTFFEEMLEGNRWVGWVAEVDKRIVSHVFVQIIDTIPRPGRKKSPFGYVTNVYTIPEYRSRGIGSLVMKEVHRWAREKGLTFLVVWPSELSVEFYERHGFHRAEEVMEHHLSTW